MAETYFRVPYGEEELAFTLPAGMPGLDHQPRPVEPLAEPVGAARLRELARASGRACIVFTDATRAAPGHVLVPGLLRALQAAGVRDGDITVLCGVGMHRPSSAKEKIDKLGAEDPGIARQCPIVCGNDLEGIGAGPGSTGPGVGGAYRVPFPADAASSRGVA